MPRSSSLQMILAAVEKKNESTTKTDIINYIKTETNGDSLDIALQYMVQSGKLFIAEPQSKHHNKYILAQPSLITGQDTVEQTV